MQPILKVSLTARSVVINNQLHYASGWEEIYECPQCKYLGIECIEANSSYLQLHEENKAFAKMKKERVQINVVKEQPILETQIELHQEIVEPHTEIMSETIQQEIQTEITQEEIHQELEEIKVEIVKQEMELEPIKIVQPEIKQLALAELQEKPKELLELQTR